MAKTQKWPFTWNLAIRYFLAIRLPGPEIGEIDNKFAKQKVNSWYIREIDSELAKYEVNSRTK